MEALSSFTRKTMPLEGHAMTQPAEGAPGAQPNAPAPIAPTAAPGAPAAPPAPPAQGLDPNAPIDFDKLDPNVRQYIANLRTEAGSHRQGKSAAEQAAAATKQQLDAVLAALGRNPDGSALVDPEKAAAELAARTEAAETAAWAAGVKLEIHRLAPKLGADFDALLDSNSFVDSLDELLGDDTSSQQFRTALEAKIRDAVVQNPNVRSRSTGAARMGADITGSGGGTTERPKSLREAFTRKANS